MASDTLCSLCNGERIDAWAVDIERKKVAALTVELAEVKTRLAAYQTTQPHCETRLRAALFEARDALKEFKGSGKQISNLASTLLMDLQIPVVQ
jgi:hypothetical protein